MRGRLFSVALLAAVLLTANAFAANAKHAHHRKPQSVNALHSQTPQHSQARQHSQAEQRAAAKHRKSANKNAGRAHAKKQSRHV